MKPAFVGMFTCPIWGIVGYDLWPYDRGFILIVNSTQASEGHGPHCFTRSPGSHPTAPGAPPY